MDGTPRMSGMRAQDASPDAVGGMLAEIRVAAASIAQFAFGPPWSVELSGVPSMFLLTQGKAWLHHPKGAPTMLAAGDSVLTLRGGMIRLASSQQAGRFAPIAEIWAANGGVPVTFEGYRVPLEMRWGGSTADCRMIGFAMTLSRFTSSSALVRSAPDIVVQRAGASDHRLWTNALETMIARERIEPAPGFGAYGGAMSQLLLVQLLRAFLTRKEGETPPAFDIAQSGLARVIHNLHLDPGRRWTIDAMAADAGMSRTSFIARFATLTGATPFDYLSRCRMDHAAMALRTGSQRIADVAVLSGYQSERAFRGAFLRSHGMAPLAYRRRHAQHRKTDP